MRSTPSRSRALRASGSDAAPAPHPTSRTEPPSGSASSARRFDGVRSCVAVDASARLANSSTGKPPGGLGGRVQDRLRDRPGGERLPPRGRGVHSVTRRSGACGPALSSRRRYASGHGTGFPRASDNRTATARPRTAAVAVARHLELVGDRGHADGRHAKADVHEVAEDERREEVGLHVRAGEAPVDVVRGAQALEEGGLGDLDEPERRGVVVVARCVRVRTIRCVAASTMPGRTR